MLRERGRGVSTRGCGVIASAGASVGVLVAVTQILGAAFHFSFFVSFGRLEQKKNFEDVGELASFSKHTSFRGVA